MPEEAPDSSTGPASWPATRDHALAVLQDFVPRAGPAYASRRNYDLGPGRHTAVSTLSPYLRRRLVTEQEVVSSAIAAHGLKGAEKFVEEVIWRGYFKGWLERRPRIWADYRAALEADSTALEGNAALRKTRARAEGGNTGIECFDAWAAELTQTGYLHNHARMWFASIWIFTLQLPWRLGADFFYRHLLDGDAASNTLSWRWVAGLHTRGKTYAADAGNIARFTEGRFRPSSSEFPAGVTALDGTEPEGLPAVQAVPEVPAPQAQLPSALLITEEDCHPESLLPAETAMTSAAMVPVSRLRSVRPTAEAVIRFEQAALNDTAARLKRQYGLSTDSLPTDQPAALAAWARDNGVRQLVTPYLPQGPAREWVQAARSAVETAGIRVAMLRRAWDDAIWPHATAGYFKVKRRIPGILRQLEVID